MRSRLLGVACLLFLGCSGGAPSRLTLSLVSSPSEAFAGDVVDVPFTLEGDRRGDVVVRLSDPPDALTARVVVVPAASRSGVLQLLVSRTATPGGPYAVNLEAAGESTRAFASFSLTLKEVQAVEVTGVEPASPRVRAGETTDVVVTLTRRGTPLAAQVSLVSCPQVSAAAADATALQASVRLTLRAEPGASNGPRSCKLRVEAGGRRAEAPLSVAVVVPPGTPDPSFGVLGVALDDAQGLADLAGLVLSSDGVLAVGQVGTAAKAAFYDATGRRDATRGAAGLIDLGVPNAYAVRAATSFHSGFLVAVQDDELTRLVKLAPDGQTQPLAELPRYSTIALQPLSDGALVLGSASPSPTDAYQASRARVALTGALTQELETWADAYGCRTHQLLEAADGSTYLVATCVAFDGPVAARFSSDGTLDASWGQGGVASSAAPLSSSFFYGADRAYGALTPDGELLLLGSRGSNGEVTAVRFNAAGQLSAPFGAQGAAVLQLGAACPCEAFGLVMESDGRFVVVGSSQASAGRVATVTRFSSAGLIDTTFGTAGSVTASLGCTASRWTAAVSDTADNLWLGGTCELTQGRKAAMLSRIAR